MIHLLNIDSDSLVVDLTFIITIYLQILLTVLSDFKLFKMCSEKKSMDNIGKNTNFQSF